MSKIFTLEEVVQHKKEVDSKVYDFTKFAAMAFLSFWMTKLDATEAFFSLHRHEVLLRPQFKRLVIGSIAGVKQQLLPPEPGAPSLVPYAEPTWLSKGYHSPYYKPHHRALQVAYHKLIEEVVLPDAQAREEDGKRPSQSVFDEMAKLEIVAMRMGSGSHPKGRSLMGGLVKPEEAFLIMNFGQPALRERVGRGVFAGKELCSFAITEAFAGSDVAGLRCLATRVVENGWRVTGRKKWIINAAFADYFTVGCHTEQGVLVVLFIKRGPGVETKTIKTSYSTAAGTAYTTFDDVFQRWGMCTSGIGAQGLIVEECLKWSNQRKVFGKPLHSQAVIRSKLAAMISRVESAQAWPENITFQMNHMKYLDQAEYLAGPIDLLKRYATSPAQETAKDAVQIFGGRTVPFDAIFGGTEDVLGDLGVRQALRKMPKDARG